MRRKRSSSTGTKPRSSRCLELLRLAANVKRFCHQINADEVFGTQNLGTCVAIVHCAVSAEVSYSTGPSLDAAAGVVVVSSHSIGPGLRVIARASTSTDTGMISRFFLMLSLIST